MIHTAEQSAQAQGLAQRLLHAAEERNILPTILKQWIQRRCSLFNARGDKWIERNPFRHEPHEWAASGRWPYTLGIVQEFWHLHWPYIAACRHADVSYKILDISGSDWLDVLANSGCDAFLSWPSVQYSPWKEMFDERLRCFSMMDRRLIFPDIEALWMWESKRRMNYWLKTHNFPHPKTWIFYDQEQALSFSANSELPLVFKTNMGSGASGVKIFRKRQPLIRHIKQCFKNGISTYRRAKQDREHGSIILQEYLPDVREWRSVRIGNSYFAYEKGRKFDFHSGSKVFLYDRPPDEVLNLTKAVTESGNFRSMNVDIFITADGKLLINELQTLFGQAGSREICRVNGKTGRMIYDSAHNEWIFEQGEFCMNYMCNLRVEHVLSVLTDQCL